MDDKRRTLREIKSIVEYLRDLKGAVSIEVGDVKVQFLPKEPEEAKKVTEVIKTVIKANTPNPELDQINAEVKAEVEENKKMKDLDPDLFLSST